MTRVHVRSVQVLVGIKSLVPAGGIVDDLSIYYLILASPELRSAQSDLSVDQPT